MAYFHEISMAAVFHNYVEKYGDKACVAYKKNGTYTHISWREMKDLVGNIACYLLSRGINKGDRVSIFSANRYEWWVTDLAALSINAVDVPIYPTNSAKETSYILDNSEASVCFAGTKEQLDKVLEIRNNLPNLKDIIIFDNPGEKIPGVITFSEALEIGKAYKKKEELVERLMAIQPADPATIIYTSGTTGNPKGVLLSHQNLLVNTQQCSNVGGKLWSLDFDMLSYLPLSHGFERTVGYYLAIYQGRTVYFSESFAQIIENFCEVRPGFIVSVPRLFEKLHAGILSKVAQAPPSKKKIFTWAMDIARRNLPYICHNRPRTGLFALQYALADRLVLSKLKQALGLDRLQIAISGGGALSVPDIEFFLGLDIRVLEGFGITETSPCTNCNTADLIKPGTCGRPELYTEEKIDDDGELLIRGPQVMLGYYKDEEATRQAFTEDGFFKSGDIAEFDEDGFLKITGRKKEIIVTAGGKNIAPLYIEKTLLSSSFIEQVALIGEKKKYLSALIVPSFADLEVWAKNNKIEFTDHEALVKNAATIKLFEDEVARTTADLGQVEKIKKFTLMSAEWAQETGELTPTLKVKRRVIDQKYAAQIDSMYPTD